MSVSVELLKILSFLEVGIQSFQQIFSIIFKIYTLVIIEGNYLVFDIMARDLMVILKVIESFLNSQFAFHFRHIQDHQEISYWPKHEL